MKTHLKEMIVFLIALVFFHVIVFVAPFSRTETFWIGYAFGLVSIILSFIIECKVSFRKSMKSRFLGLSLLYIATAYMAAQLTLSLIFMGFSTIPPWTAVLINMVLLCAVLIGLVGTSGATSTIQQIDDTVQKKVYYIKNLQMNIDLVKSNCSDSATRKALEKLSDAIKYSDPMSHKSLADIEAQLQSECELLENLVASNQLESAQEKIKFILALLQKRNQQSLLLK